MRKETGVRGVMAARGLLANPVSSLIRWKGDKANVADTGPVRRILFHSEARGRKFHSADNGLQPDIPSVVSLFIPWPVLLELISPPRIVTDTYRTCSKGR